MWPQIKTRSKQKTSGIPKAHATSCWHSQSDCREGFEHGAVKSMLALLSCWRVSIPVCEALRAEPKQNWGLQGPAAATNSHGSREKGLAKREAMHFLESRGRGSERKGGFFPLQCWAWSQSHPQVEMNIWTQEDRNREGTGQGVMWHDGHSSTGTERALGRCYVA